MSSSMSMADLLAKQDSHSLAIFRGQEIEGIVVAILPQEIILDLGTKSEGVLQKKDLPASKIESLKIGDKITSTVIYTENDSGQVVLGLNRASLSNKNTPNAQKFRRFETAQKSNQVLTGKGLEVNKGGLIVEVGGVRGFLPSSQVSLSQAANLDDMVGKDIQVTVIEIDSNQNRLIFSQKNQISEEVQQKLSKLKSGDIVKGQVAAILQFGIFVTLEGAPSTNVSQAKSAKDVYSDASGVEGLVHISELSWEKTDDPNSIFKIGDKVEAKVISVDKETGRANLSIKQLSQDPFEDKVKDLQSNDITKLTITKVTSLGVFGDLEGGIEGFIPSSKLEDGSEYKVGEAISCVVDTIDTQKRRVNLAPFITSTAGLIYK